VAILITEDFRDVCNFERQGYKPASRPILQGLPGYDAVVVDDFVIFNTPHGPKLKAFRLSQTMDWKPGGRHALLVVTMTSAMMLSTVNCGIVPGVSIFSTSVPADIKRCIAYTSIWVSSVPTLSLSSELQGFLLLKMQIVCLGGSPLEMANEGR
jgi:hypothetical protein